MAGLISVGNSLPEMASSFVVTAVTDLFGFTGTEQALRAAEFFPLSLVRCVAITRGVIRVFNSSAVTDVSGSGAPVSVSRILCGR